MHTGLMELRSLNEHYSSTSKRTLEMMFEMQEKREAARYVTSDGFLEMIVGSEQALEFEKAIDTYGRTIISQVDSHIHDYSTDRDLQEIILILGQVRKPHLYLTENSLLYTDTNGHVNACLYDPKDQSITFDLLQPLDMQRPRIQFDNEKKELIYSRFGVSYHHPLPRSKYERLKNSIIILFRPLELEKEKKPVGPPIRDGGTLVYATSERAPIL